MKALVCLILLLLVNTAGYNQDKETDSLMQIANAGKKDSLTVNALVSLTIINAQSSPDKALAFANKAKDIAIETGFTKGEAYAYKWLGIINNNKGNYYEALVNSNTSLNLFEALGDKVGTSNLLSNIGAFYGDKDENSKAVEYYLQSLDFARQSNNKLRIETALNNIGVIYSKNTETNDKALAYYVKALPYALQIKDDESTGILYTNIGEIYAAKNQFDKAKTYYQKAIQTLGNSSSTAYTYTDYGKLYLQKRQYDSVGVYFDKAYAIAQQNNSPIDILQSLIGKAQLETTIGDNKDAIVLFTKALDIGKTLESVPELKQVYEGLSTIYKNQNDYKNAFIFQNLLNELYNSENKKKLNFNTATLAYSVELQKQTGKIAMLIKQNELQESDLAKERLARNISIASLAVVLLFTIILLININQRKKLNRLLSLQNKKIEAQKINVERALSELKAAQSQLIHSEKMASLGELTAGIAHEIQNPLNFVNNFSEINRDLIEELKVERLKPVTDRDSKLENEILDNVQLNEEKINFHGKRAETIVKGMLQHSRKNAGQKEWTDINVFAAEYLRISYHGMKAKTKDFQAEAKSSFDPSIGKINIIPQDIGIVLLNLLNNAFYAVHEKKKTADENYIPSVLLATKKSNGKVEIKISDNGPGVPQNLVDKIFQPFFTTKPVGQGTGLGLFLSYDIIKAHSGEIDVETEEGIGTTFIIQLP